MLQSGLRAQGGARCPRLLCVRRKLAPAAQGGQRAGLVVKTPDRCPPFRCKPGVGGADSAARQLRALPGGLGVLLGTAYTAHRGAGREKSILKGWEILPGSKAPPEFTEKENEGNFRQSRQTSA